MNRLLLVVILGSALSACFPVELSVQRTSVQEQELPYKTYQFSSTVCPAADGGITTVLARTAANQPSGSYNSPYLQRSEIVAIKTDGLGKVLWTKLVASDANGFISRPFIYPLPDGGYFVYVFIRAASPGYQELRLIHLDSNGTVLTQNTVEDGKIDPGILAIQIISLAEKGCVISGSVGTVVGTTAVTYPRLLRFDGQGRLVWNRSYPEVAGNVGLYGLAAASDGSLILSWTVNSVNSAESFLLKVDANGEQVWFRNYSPVAANVVGTTPDNGYVLLGKINAAPVSTALYTLNRDGDVQLNKLYPLPVGQTAVTPLAVFGLADTRVLAYFIYPGTIDFVTTDLAGAGQNRQSVPVGTQFAPGTISDLIRLPDGSFAFAGVASGAAVLFKTKPDKTLQWSTTLAVDK